MMSSKPLCELSGRDMAAMADVAILHNFSILNFLWAVSSSDEEVTRSWQDKSAPTRTVVSSQSIQNFERSGWTARIQSSSSRCDK